jgi:hypothetical protein
MTTQPKPEPRPIERPTTVAEKEIVIRREFQASIDEIRALREKHAEWVRYTRQP